MAGNAGVAQVFGDLDRFDKIAAGAVETESGRGVEILGAFRAARQEPRDPRAVARLDRAGGAGIAAFGVGVDQPELQGRGRADKGEPEAKGRNERDERAQTGGLGHEAYPFWQVVPV